MRVITNSTSCYICGKMITQQNDDINRHDYYGNLKDALNDHWYERDRCKRDLIIEELISGKKIDPNASEFYDRNFNYSDWLKRTN